MDVPKLVEKADRYSQPISVEKSSLSAEMLDGTAVRIVGSHIGGSGNHVDRTSSNRLSQRCCCSIQKSLTRSAD